MSRSSLSLSLAFVASLMGGLASATCDMPAPEGQRRDTVGAGVVLPGAAPLVGTETAPPVDAPPLGGAVPLGDVARVADAVEMDAGDAAAPEGALPEADALPDQARADFGTIRPPVPLPSPESLTTHGLAGFEVVAIHAHPDLGSARLGYLRIGTRVMVTPKIADAGTGCAAGFHALGNGGFVCASKGFLVDGDKPPYMYLPPPPARVEDPIPYDYGVVTRSGTPLWWKMVDAESIALATARYEAELAVATADAAAKAPPNPSPAAAAPSPSQRDEPQEPAAELPGIDDAPEAPPPTPEEAAAQRRAEAEAARRAEKRAEEDRERVKELARKAARLPLNSKSPFLESGSVITLGEKVRDGGLTWWRTTRGAFVQSSRVHRKSTGDFHGGDIPPGTVAFGFVMPETASASVMSPRGKLEWQRKLAYRELLAFVAEVEVGGRPYLVTADGVHVRRSDLRLAELATRPPEVRAYERWIDVDLERQLLVAYQGDAPVYATLVSTGKRGTDVESFVTPPGKFRIGTKHVSSSMGGNTASDGSYSIEDVPWAMFFHGNFALHGAFWHDRFGNRRSHGCVNLGPTDARWLFLWTTPFLPEGWHGVTAHDGAPGSMVVVH